MSGKAKKILSAIFYPAIITLAFVLIWNLLAFSAGSEFLFPPLDKTLEAFLSLLITSSTYEALLGTLGRTILSFIISLVLAVAFALLSALYKPVKKLLAPAVSFFRSLPTMAVTLIVAIWLGSRYAPVIVSLMVIMPTAYSAFSEGVDAIERDILDMARIDGARGSVLAFRFMLPLALSFSKKSVSATLSLNIKLMVAAETLAGTSDSIGHSMMLSSIYFETARLMALTVLTVLVSVASEWLLYSLLRLLDRA